MKLIPVANDQWVSERYIAYVFTAVEPPQDLDDSPTYSITIKTIDGAIHEIPADLVNEVAEILFPSSS